MKRSEYVMNKTDKDTARCKAWAKLRPALVKTEFGNPDLIKISN